MMIRSRLWTLFFFRGDYLLWGIHMYVHWMFWESPKSLEVSWRLVNFLWRLDADPWISVQVIGIFWILWESWWLLKSLEVIVESCEISHEDWSVISRILGTLWKPSEVFKVKIDDCISVKSPFYQFGLKYSNQFHSEKLPKILQSVLRRFMLTTEFMGIFSRIFAT